MNIRNLLDRKHIYFDGAMGTYMAYLDRTYNGDYERANLAHAELVYRIHMDYIRAGANVITTNTFAANRQIYDETEAEKLIRAGWEIAVKAAKPGNSVGDAETEICIAASIGQINGEADLRTSEYIWMAEKFLDAGAENFIFETQSSLVGISETAAYIKEKNPGAFVMVGFSVNDAGFTSEGLFAKALLKDAEADENIDAVGLNCGCSAVHMKSVINKLQQDGTVIAKPFIIMPNAGYPVIVNRRTVYEGIPDIFANKMAEIASAAGKNMAPTIFLGGCCGTTPEHIARMADALKSAASRPADILVPDKTERNLADADPGSCFWDKLERGEKPVAVELDPPADCNTAKFLKGVEDLRAGGVDIITIADCPIGRARMDSSLLACKIHREYGVEALPHMTCRDRNLNATQALMLGLYAEGIRNMLLVTGDPVPSAQRDEVKAVYQFNSRKFAAFASSLKEQMFPGDVHFFGALNVNARNFDVQIKLAKEKIENGIIGFLTQPVLTEEAFENLKRARDELDGYILGGIIPVVSERNARFMDSEISGINVDPKVTEMYVGKDRDEAEKLAVEISSEIARRIGPYVDGYYYMTPFQRTGLIRRIIDAV